jgi:hypothetical protein
MKNKLLKTSSEALRLTRKAREKTEMFRRFTIADAQFLLSVMAYFHQN